MDTYTMIRCTRIRFVVGVCFLLSLHCTQVSSQDNDTSKPVNIVAILEAPYVIKDPVTGRFTGLLIDVLREAGVALDHVDTPVEDVYGWERSPGNFTGVIGDLVDGKYDLAVAPFSIKSSRAEVVTFTQPVLHHGYQVLYKMPKHQEWNFDRMDAVATLLKPFSPGLWFLILLTIVLASVSLYVIRRFSPYEDDVTDPAGQQRADNSLTRMSWGNSWMYLLGSLTGRNVSVTPRSTSGCVLTAAWWVFSLMTVGAYIAGLVSVLFKTNPHLRTLPFGNLEEMLSQTEVKILAVRNSGTYNYMASHQGNVEKRIFQYWQNNGDDVMVGSLKKALKKMKKGDGEYGVFLSEDLAHYLASQEPCDKMLIGGPVGDVTIGFACPKGSPVCDSLNHAILRIHEEGRMEQLRQKYFMNGCHMKAETVYEGEAFFDTFGGSDPGDISPGSITIRRFSGAFIVLVLGCLLAMMVLVVEILLSRRKGNIHRRLKNFARQEDAQRIHDRDFVQDHDDA